MFEETSWVPAAACSTFLAISCVAAPCSSTAEAMPEATSSISAMILPMPAIASTACWVEFWMAAICVPISSVPWPSGWQVLHFRGHHREALAGVSGPGRLDGGVQGQQVGLVGDVGNQGDDVADLLGRSASPWTLTLVSWASSTAARAISEECVTCRLIS